MIRIFPLPSGSPYFEDCGNFCPVLPQNSAGFSMPKIIALWATIRNPNEQEKMHFHLRFPDVSPLEEPAAGPVVSRCLALQTSGRGY
jgi:hypothetical protein